MSDTSPASMPDYCSSSSTKEVLDLFAGLGGFSQAFAADDAYCVTTVDIEEDFEPDVCADILDLKWQDLPDADIILASPPCTAFTQLTISDNWQTDKAGMNHPITDFAKTSLTLVYHTIGLIKAIDPDWWVMENPRGMLRKVLHPPDYHVWYCQYDGDSAKPTDLWGHLPLSFEPKTCKYNNPFCDHPRVKSGVNWGGIQSMGTSAERAKVPFGLSESIKHSIENPKPIQQTL